MDTIRLEPVPSLRGNVPPSLTTARAPNFGFTQNTFLEPHVMTRQRAITEYNVQTQFSFEVFSIVCDIASNQLLCKNVTQ